MPKAKKVVNLAEREKEKTLREAALFAEACAKHNPSPEARAFVNDMLVRDEAAGERRDLAADAVELALEKFWLGYYTKASVQRQAERLKQELGHAEASPAERVLIEHAVVCHVRLGMTEHLYSRNASGRIDVADHWERRLTLAQKRFARAMTTLAQVRGLLARAEAAKEAGARSRSARAMGVLKQMTG